jgi:hypothetical protein
MFYQVESTIMEPLFGVLPSLNHKKPECDKKRTSHLVVADGDMLSQLLGVLLSSCALATKRESNSNRTHRGNDKQAHSGMRPSAQLASGIPAASSAVSVTSEEE